VSRPADLAVAGEAPRPRPSLALAFGVLWPAAALAARSLGIWASLGSLAAALGAVALVVDPASTRALLRPTRGRVALGIGVGAMMALATHLLYPMAVQQVPSLAVETAQLYVAFRGPPAWLIALGLVPVIAGEELVWRGVVQSALHGRVGRWSAAGLTAVAYAAAHAPTGSAVLTLAALGCGLVWSSLRARTGSLLPALLSHLLWDAIVLVWLPLQTR
jgi:membrane protease YdiL (CAAX protease family)